jgi:hypothetical protein
MIKESFLFFADLILEDNHERNEIIVSNILYDVLFNYIVDSENNGKIDYFNKDETNYCNDYVYYEQYDDLFKGMIYFIQCSKKSINVASVGDNLINEMFSILRKFKLHNMFSDKYNGIIKAYNYGSTSQTYILNDMVIKVYNDKLRWVMAGHNISSDIFIKELSILKLNIGPKLIDYNENEKLIIMSYCGESLYNDFKLPENWEDQIRDIFNILTQNNIFYPEFKIQNILVLNDIITFVDYGLAINNENIDNTVNCNNCIKLLKLLEEKFKTVTDRDKRYELYSTFINNTKL